jgi:hypothetical protein
MPKISDGSAVLANNSTQVLVAPINNPSPTKNQRSDGRKSPALDENIGFRDPISSFLSQKTVCPARFMRVLSKSLVNIEGLQLPCLTLIAISEGEF